jgi:Icc protein
MHTRGDSKVRKAINRRDFLKVGGLVGAASLLGSCAAPSPAVTPLPTMQPWPTSAPPAEGRSTSPTPGPTAGSAATQGTQLQEGEHSVAVRFAHISDMHIQPGGPGAESFARALRDLQKRNPNLDFVLNTGDCVMDTLHARKADAESQWETFRSVVDAECRLPIHHAIGNHDVWGWGLPPDTQKSLKSDPMFGKGMALQRLQVPERYYAFDEGGWRFVVLDSTHPAEVAPGEPYTGKLDEEQFGWLSSQLQKTHPSMPVCVVSHIPVLAACEYLDGDNETSGNWVVPGAWVHIDARRMWALFWEHPNVKLCLSGHTHQVEDLRYHGMRYMTNGAISANWWNGPYFDFPPGYVVVTLYNDGSADSEFVAY